AYVRGFDPFRQRKAFADFVHRWTRGPDLVALLWILKQMFDRSGSIEGFFLEGFDAAAPDVSAALDSFSARALALDVTPGYGPPARRPHAGKPGGPAAQPGGPGRLGVCYFFPRASAGSGCKRLNLFMRWMVRRDAL